MADFIPLPKEFLEKIRDEDRFILAYPRSGSRWLTFILTDVTNQTLGVDISWKYDDLMLGEFAGSKTKRSLDFSDNRVVLNSHAQPRESSTFSGLGLIPIFRSHHLTEIFARRRHKAVYLVRDPAAVFVSYFHFARDWGHLAKNTTLKEFCQDQIPKWLDHVSAAIRFHEELPEKILFLHYGSTGASPFTAGQILKGAAHLGLPCPSTHLVTAMDNLRDFLGRLNTRPETRHQRGGNHGTIGQIDPALRFEILSRTGTVFQTARKLANTQCEEAACPQETVIPEIGDQKPHRQPTGLAYGPHSGTIGFQPKQAYVRYQH